jgi:hypothetical protein
MCFLQSQTNVVRRTRGQLLTAHGLTACSLAKDGCRRRRRRRRRRRASAGSKGSRGCGGSRGSSRAGDWRRLDGVAGHCDGRRPRVSRSGCGRGGRCSRRCRRAAGRRCGGRGRRGRGNTRRGGCRGSGCGAGGAGRDGGGAHGQVHSSVTFDSPLLCIPAGAMPLLTACCAKDFETLAAVL